MGSKTKLTSAAGIPVGDNQNSPAAGPRGPVPAHRFILPRMNPILTPD
jgi:catalase